MAETFIDRIIKNIREAWEDGTGFVRQRVIFFVVGLVLLYHKTHPTIRIRGGKE